MSENKVLKLGEYYPNRGDEIIAWYRQGSLTLWTAGVVCGSFDGIFVDSVDESVYLKDCFAFAHVPDIEKFILEIKRHSFGGEF